MSLNQTDTPPQADEVGQLYIELIKKSLTFSLWDAQDGSILEVSGGPLMALKGLAWKILHLLQNKKNQSNLRQEGRDWPALGETMIGLQRMNNLQHCVETVLREQIPGDFIETGVWRGGATIFMRAILKAYHCTDRNVFVADSFEGLPKPDTQHYPADRGDKHHTFKSLAISLEQVQANFEKYQLLDPQVQFLKGWFKDTLPTLPSNQLAVIRLDGDMYQSTMDGLVNLYPKLSQGGFIIIDDYGAVPACKQAVEDYRKEHHITEPITSIDWTGSFWRKDLS